MKLEPPVGQPLWLFTLFRRIETAFDQPQEKPLRLKSYAVADLPTASNWTGGMIYVSNEAGGAVPAFSDGTNWRRVTDRAVVS